MKSRQNTQQGVSSEDRVSKKAKKKKWYLFKCPGFSANYLFYFYSADKHIWKSNSADIRLEELLTSVLEKTILV